MKESRSVSHPCDGRGSSKDLRGVGRLWKGVERFRTR